MQFIPEATRAQNVVSWLRDDVLRVVFGLQLLIATFGGAASSPTRTSC